MHECNIFVRTYHIAGVVFYSIPQLHTIQFTLVVCHVMVQSLYRGFDSVTLIARLFDYWLAQLSLYSLPAAGTEAIDEMPVENVSFNYPMECTVQGVMCVRLFVHGACLVIQCL